MPDRDRKRVPDHRSDVLKISPQGSPAHPRNTEGQSIRGLGKRRRTEMKQPKEVWRS